MGLWPNIGWSDYMGAIARQSHIAYGQKIIIAKLQLNISICKDSSVISSGRWTDLAMIVLDFYDEQEYIYVIG